MNHDHAAVREAISKAMPVLAGGDYEATVEEIKSAAWEAARRIADHHAESFRRDQQAELKKLGALMDKQDWATAEAALSELSPDVWWVFQQVGFDLDTAIEHPMEFRDAITRLIAADLPAKRRPGEVRHDAGLALARRVFAALAPHESTLGLSLSAHGKDYLRSSQLVQLLGRIGDSIGLVLEATAWRDYLVEIRKNGEDALTRG